MVVALGRVIQNNADIWAASRPARSVDSGLVGSLLARSFGLRPGGEGGRGEDGLVKLLFSAAVWTFAAFNLTLDIVRLTNRLLPYFLGVRGCKFIT